MTSSEFPSAEFDGTHPSTLAAEAAPELGDVIESIDEAANSFKSVVKNEADSLLFDFRTLIREQPIASIAIAGALAYLMGRIGR